MTAVTDRNLSGAVGYRQAGHCPVPWHVPHRLFPFGPNTRPKPSHIAHAALASHKRHGRRRLSSAAGASVGTTADSSGIDDHRIAITH